MASMLALVVSLAACNDGLTVIPAEREWSATLEGVAGWEHLSGASTVQHATGTSQFTAAAEIAGDEAGAVRPWHVHFNDCATGGAIVGEDADYPRLVIDAGGTATAAATVPQPLQAGAAYHVNVHLSEAEMQTIIACGDLILVN